MISKELLKKIRRIQITTSRMVTDTFAGKYQSVFKGKGMEFYEVREYVPGDEIRTIDWNVTARYGHPYVKKFIEERELTVMLLLDMSGSSRFGTQRQLKSQLAAELCSVFALSAIKNNDKVGLIIFTDRIEKFLAPRKGLRHVLRVIREALYFKPAGKGTDMALALDYLNRVTKRKTITFIISDFFDRNIKRRLAIAHKRHDLIAVTVSDPREYSLPDVGIAQLSDAESGQQVHIDTSRSLFRRRYTQDAFSRQKELQKLFRSIGMDNMNISTSAPYEKELIRFFRERQLRLR